MKLRASINKNMLNGREQHLQLPKKGLSAAKITSSLEKRVGSPQQLLAPATLFKAQSRPFRISSLEQHPLSCYMARPIKQGILQVALH